MGRKTNSNSLRLKKTNKDYNDCWYGDILYSAHLLSSLKIKKSITHSFKCANICASKFSLIGAQKRADALLCYLDPKIQKEGCEYYNLKFHGSTSKIFCVKKKHNQKGTFFQNRISLSPEKKMSNDLFFPGAFSLKGEEKGKNPSKYVSTKNNDTQQFWNVSPHNVGETPLLYHTRILGLKTQNPLSFEKSFLRMKGKTIKEKYAAPLEYLFAKGSKSALLEPPIQEIASDYSKNALKGEIFAAAPNVPGERSLQPHLAHCPSTSKYKNNNILTFKNTHTLSKKKGGFLFPCPQRDFYKTESCYAPKSLFFSFLMGICAFNKNFHSNGKNVDLKFLQKFIQKGGEQDYSNVAIITKYTLPSQFTENGLCRRNAYNPPFFDKKEKHAYMWNLAECYTDFWGNFLSLCFMKSNNEKASANFLCCYVAYFLERKVLFRTIKQQLCVSLRPRKQKKNRETLSDWYTSFFAKNKSKIAGIRISCSGRVGGRSKKAQRSRKDTFMWGETGLHVFSRRLDFAQTIAETAFGVVGIQVWVCYKGY